jgi:hypothetical protein
MARLQISVARLGRSDWPRFAVQDNKGRYWDGKWWTDNPRRARLHHREQDAANEATVLNDSIEPRRFSASVGISVEHDEPFTVEQVRELLERSKVWLILPEEHDLEGVEIDVIVDCQSLKELE